MRKLRAILAISIMIIIVLSLTPIYQPVSSYVFDKIVDRIIIEDPAELDGAPNDIREFNVWVEREYDESRKTQIRNIALKLKVHTTFKGTPTKPFYFIINMKWYDFEGNEHVTGVIGGPYVGTMTGVAWFQIDGIDYDSPFCLTRIEDEGNFKISACRMRCEMGYYEYHEDIDGYVRQMIDTTKWSDDLLNVTDNRQAKNVINLLAVTENDCVKLTWGKPELKESEMNYDWYRVYRDDKRIMTIYGQTEYLDCGVTAGETYKYTVRPLTKWLVEGGSTNCRITYNPKTEVTVDKKEIDFGTLEPNETKTEKIILKNIGSINADVKLETEADWFTINPSEITLEPDGVYEIELTTIPEKMTPNSKHQGGIILSWGIDGYTPMFAGAKVGEDKTPPVTTIDPLTNVSGKSTYTITGKTEPGCRVVVNGVEAKVTDDTFSVEINLNPAPSKTPVVVWSSDKFGNDIKETLGEIINTINRSVVMTIGKTIMYVDGESKIIDPPPTIIEGRTMVPVRAIAEAFGAQVGWIGETKTVSINLFGRIILLQIQSTTATVNGEEREVDPPAQILNGRTMVPFRFIAEALGATVEWNGEKKEITINLEITP